MDQLESEIQPIERAPHPVPERRGAILINVGTPDGPTTEEVKNYLKQFLMDRYVIDIPFLFRWILINGIILRTRPAQSAALYQKIWTQKGSPLLVYHNELTDKLQKRLPTWNIQPAMRYGKPSIETALKNMERDGVNDIVIVPLYPQYSLSATMTSVQQTLSLAKKVHPKAVIKEMDAFYDNELFIESFVQVIQKNLVGFDFDHVLFSFHGLPERHLHKAVSAKTVCKFSSECCAEVTEKNSKCYRAQSFQTTRLIAERLGLKREQYSIGFQSRLGRTPWIQPFSDELYRTLPKKGIKRLAVICPSFVADCLETLEEVQIRGLEEFRAHGGEELRLIPSLNASDTWVSALVHWLSHAEDSDKAPVVRYLRASK